MAPVTASPAPSDVTRAAALCPQFRRKRQQIEAMRARTASLTTRAAGDDAGPRGSDDAGGGNADGDEAEEEESDDNEPETFLDWRKKSLR